MFSAKRKSSTALFLYIIIFAACNDKNMVGTDLITSQINFPEFFIEKGSDVDSSFISIRGIQINNDTLLIEGTSWGVIEYGLFMEREDLKQKILFKMMGECGTVTMRTFKKVTINSYLTTAETDTLWEIGFTNFRDTLNVIKTIIH